jgi:hypothetical protein
MGVPAARRPVNRKRVLRVMRERRLIQRRRRLDRRRRPGFFCVERPDQLWHLDMTSVWVAEHGWVYLMAAIDCCTREIVRLAPADPLPSQGSRRTDPTRRDRASDHARDAHARHRQRLGVHRQGVQDGPDRPRNRAPPQRLPRPPDLRLLAVPRTEPGLPVWIVVLGEGIDWCSIVA